MPFTAGWLLPSHPPHKMGVMPTTPADAANAALRAYLLAHAGRPWTPAELAELARLRSAYLAAGKRGYVTAA